ncbi:MAG TPA: hypothetical protein VKA65_09675 [Acidimicrobiales bacterium]|nr:hypothetical protein [Acidimicrobiales bacterium]
MRRFLATKVGKILSRLVLGGVGLGVGLVLVSLLREATLSTHQAIDPDSTIEVIVRARSHNAEDNQTLDEMVEAQLLTCRLEVTSDMVGPLRTEGDGQFRALFAPSMDQTNRRQFKGCVEDFVIDGVQIDVLSLAEPE